MRPPKIINLIHDKDENLVAGIGYGFITYRPIGISAILVG